MMHWRQFWALVRDLWRLRRHTDASYDGVWYVDSQGRVLEYRGTLKVHSNAPLPPVSLDGWEFTKLWYDSRDGSIKTRRVSREEMQR